MSRSQRNVRMGQGGNAKPEGGSATGLPAEVTQKDGAQNIAGDVTRMSADDYTKMIPVSWENN